MLDVQHDVISYERGILLAVSHLSNVHATCCYASVRFVEVVEMGIV